MRRQMVHRLLAQAIKLDLLLCLTAYLLQQVNEQFAWVFVASLIVLLWLVVAGVCSILDFLFHEDSR